MSFAAFGLHQNLLLGIAELGYNEPTKLQQEAWTAVASGQDVFAIARSGEGKTAAFLLPLLERLLAHEERATRVLVVTATREQAVRTAEQLRALAKHSRLSIEAVYGGVPSEPQIAALEASPDVLVATPGRLLEHLEQPHGALPALEVLVLDEVGRLADMGFLPEVRRLLEQLPPRRQTLLISAVASPAVSELADELLKEPLRLQSEPVPEAKEEVSQVIYPVPEDLKRALLLALLDKLGRDKVLVFTRTKHRANRLAEWLNRHGVTSERVHGNRSQKQRADALAGFRDGTYTVLVATDLSSRGVELGELSRIVNFDVPTSAEEYAQRAGRAANQTGAREAITFAAEPDEGNLRAIERTLAKSLPRLTLPGFDYDARPEDSLEDPVLEKVAEIRPRPPENRQRPAGKSRRRGDRESKKGARPSQPAGPHLVPERSHFEDDEEEEARIRAIAEQQQAAAVAARTNPSRMGIMELRNPHAQHTGGNRPPAAGAGRRRARRSRGR